LAFYPTANSWWSLISEGLLGITLLVCGYLVFSATIRTIVREEIGMTFRTFRQN
jgi:hypothetical protein